MKGVNPDCPCGSGTRYGVCCRPFHQGGEPPDAVRLMRSRFAAFAMAELDYLWRTLDPDHMDRLGRSYEAFLAGMRGSRGKKFVRLRVLGNDEASGEGYARVLYHAEIFERGHDKSFAELSVFRKRAEGWRYLGGTTLALPVTDPRTAGLTIAKFVATAGS